MTPPGTHLLAIVRLWFDEATVEVFFEPLIADWQGEYLVAGTPLRRFGVRVRGGAAAVTAILRMSPRIITSPTHGVGRSVAMTSILFLAIPSAILLTPFAGFSSADLRGILPLYLLPSAITAALPFAMAAVALQLSQARAPGFARRQALVRCVMLAVAAQFVGLGLLVPAANQAWRQRVNALASESRFDEPLRGPRELNIVELLEPGPLAAEVRASKAQLNAERHNRLSFMLAPLCLAMIGWSVGRKVRAAGIVRITCWWLLIGIAFLMLRATDQAWGISTSVAMWLPLVVAVMGGVLVQWVQSGSSDGRSERYSMRGKRRL